MIQHAIARLILVLACLAPSLLCFGIAGYLLVHGNQEGWGWFLVVGLLCLEAPGRLFQLPDECPTCHARRQRAKPSPVYDQNQV